MKIVSSQIDGPIGSNVEDQAAGRWNSTPPLPWATAAMGRLKDAFTYLQAGSKPKALEIAQSADLRQMNQRGQSLMFAAAGRPLNKGSAELLCQILQKRGLAVDALDGHHQTALFAAAREGNEICADWLIAQGCAVDHADFRGETPLCIAFRNSQMGMVMKLLKHGASLGVKDMYGGRQPTFFCRPYFPQSLCGEAQRTAWDHEFSKEAKTWASRRGAPVEAVQRGLILAVHRPQCDDPMGISRWGRSTRDNSRERVQRDPGREWWLHGHCSTPRSNSQDPCSGAGIFFGSCGLPARAPHAPCHGTWWVGRLFWSPCERGWRSQINLQSIEKVVRDPGPHLLCWKLFNTANEGLGLWPLWVVDVFAATCEWVMAWEKQWPFNIWRCSENTNVGA